MKTFLKSNNGLVACDAWEPDCWISIVSPDEDDIRYLTEDLGIPLSFYNDIEDIDERPRIEMEQGWCLIILRAPMKSTDSDIPYTTVPVGVIFKGDIFVSICFFQIDMISDFVLYTNRKLINKTNNLDLVLRLLHSSSVWFLKYLKQINQKIKLAEKQLEKSIKNEDLQTLLQIEKCLVFFTTSLKGNDILIHRIKNLKKNNDDVTAELIEDVEIESRQALEMTNIYSDILSGMMDAYASVISNNLNVIMKLLTSISIILMIPTLLASLYGMNVPNALQNNRYGFEIILLICLLSSILGIIILKKKNWV